jgi:hypothetical protein
MRILRFASDCFLVSGNWLHGPLGPVMDIERSQDRIACVLGQGWKRVFPTGCFLAFQFKPGNS